MAEIAVAPFAGAWIETPAAYYEIKDRVMSLPSRERGLKHVKHTQKGGYTMVAPFAGAWIET